MRFEKHAAVKRRLYRVGIAEESEQSSALNHKPVALMGLRRDNEDKIMHLDLFVFVSVGLTVVVVGLL